MAETRKDTGEHGSEQAPSEGRDRLRVDDRAEDQDGSLKVHGDKLERLIPKGPDAERPDGAPEGD